MAAETELERMVIRLIGDAQHYQKTLTDAQSATATATKNINKELEAAMRRGSQVTDSVATASERYAAKIRELKGLLDQGAISQQTYTRAISAAHLQLQNAGAGAKKVSDAVRDHSQQLVTSTELLKGYVAQVVALAGVTSSISVIFGGIQLAADAEQNEIAFGTMLQSVEKGKQMVKDLQTFAAATPMETGQLQRATKTLLQFGIEGEKIIPTLRMIGDVTGGQADNFSRMTLAFGQMAATGRLMGEELNQMREAGFNPLMELSKMTKKSMGELRQEMEAGKISVDMVIGAFKSATGPGGNFAGLMEKQSKSLSGLFSTLGDDVNSARRTFGNMVIETLKLKDAIQALSRAAQGVDEFFKGIPSWMQKVIAVVTLLALAFGALAIAINPIILAFGFVASGAMKIVAAITAVKAFMLGLGGVAVAVAATWVVAIGGMVAGLVLLVKWIVETLAGFKELEKARAATAREAAFTQNQITKGGMIGMARVEAALPGRTASPEGAKAFDQVLLEESAKAERLVQIHHEALVAIRETGDEEGIKHQAENLAIATREAQKFRDVAAEIAKMGMTQRAADELKKFTKDMEIAIRTFGVADKAAALLKIQIEHGLTPAQTRNQEGLLAMMADLKKMTDAKKEAEEATRKLADAVGDMSDDLEFENEVLRMEIEGTKLSAAAKKLLRMEREGLDEASAGHLRGLIEENEALEKHKKLLEEGQKVTERVLGKDPTRRLNKEVEKLEELFNAGAIDEEVFTLGLQQAQEELDKTGKAADKLTEKFDAAASGSAEAASRIAAFFERNSVDSRNSRKVKEQLTRPGGERRPPGAEVDFGGGGDWGNGGAEAKGRVEELLQQIRDLLAKDDGEAVVLKPVELF